MDKRALQTARHQYLRELLRQDPTMSTKDLNDKVLAKHPGDGKRAPFAPAQIAKIRWDEFGVKFGRGRSAPIYRNAEIQTTVAQSQQATPEARQARLKGLVDQLREEMRAQGMYRLEITPDGKVKVAQTQQIERELPL